LLEPKKKETEFLENLKQSLSIDFQLVNNDEKYFYSKYKKKFDIVFCRAVFTPPKIFDVFKKFTKNIAFWQYSDNYRYYLQIYKNKIERNKLEILEVFKYQINNKDYFTIVFVRRDL
jgi:16S rRNA G527 N7-methylase RsmG